MKIKRNEGVRGDEFSVGRGWDRRGLVLYTVYSIHIHSIHASWVYYSLLYFTNRYWGSSIILLI